jgi:hypothetical protein
MPEPDFDQIARRIAREIEMTGQSTRSIETFDLAFIAEQLHLVWNARGAVDLANLEPIIDKLGDTMDPDNARELVEEQIRGGDR